MYVCCTLCAGLCLSVCVCVYVHATLCLCALCSACLCISVWETDWSFLCPGLLVGAPRRGSSAHHHSRTDPSNRRPLLFNFFGGKQASKSQKHRIRPTGTLFTIPRSDACKGTLQRPQCVVWNSAKVQSTSLRNTTNLLE